MLVAGLVLTIVGFADFFSGFGDVGGGLGDTVEVDQGNGFGNFWMAFVGLALLGVGARVTFAAFLGEVARYGAAEVAPVARDTIDYLEKSRQEGTALTCAKCAGTSAADAKFCDDCGLAFGRQCESCDRANDGDAKFCAGCGEPLAVT